LSLANIDSLFPADLSPDKKAQAKTLFLKRLALDAHKFYGGKMQTVPKCGIYGFNWFNVWYTPGVSKISTSIRDSNDISFETTCRGNMVAVVSDSTRVLGDGDCTPSGGMGVMEGKALIMKYLGGVDAIPLCMDSRNAQGKHDPAKIIEFVKMCQPSFGAINLEDISQPNCFRVLDELREACDIPVWHDDAQGTACVTLAGLINAVYLAGKKMSDVRIVLLGAGAANTTIARLLMADGAKGENIIMFDTKGSLNAGRKDLEDSPENYRKWELCRSTNPKRIQTLEEAFRGADVLVSASTPGPGVVKPEWVRSMAPKAIVFACANPTPEIWPHTAKEAGAYIVATGRGDFPNQVNNSICFPGILKGALGVRARKISDGMAIRCAHSLADFAKARGITPENIVPTMEESDVFAVEAADVADQAVKEGLARIPRKRDEVYAWASRDIAASHKLFESMMERGDIAEPDEAMILAARDWALTQV
jgi:malate dehydrogenase (oxaloacetate-decarboxylating)